MIRSFLIFNFFVSLAWARPEVILHSAVAVSPRGEISLADIAEVTEPTEALLQALGGVIVSKEKITSVQALNGQEIVAIIRSELRKNDVLREMSPIFKIPEKIDLKVSAAAVSREEVERKILNFARTRCLSCQYQVSLTNIPAMNSSEWILDFNNLPMKGSFIAPIQGRVGNTNQWVTGQIKVFKLVPVANRFIAMAERINKKDISMMIKEITNTRDNTLNLDDLEGQLASRPLSAGTIVMAGDIRREPAAKRGQIVKVISGDSSFEVSVNGTAEDNGFIGDMIKVKSTDTQKILSGTVIDKGVVKLQ